MSRALILFGATIILSGCFSGLHGPMRRSLGACNPAPCLKVSVSPVPELPATVSRAARERITAAVQTVLYAKPDGDEEFRGSAEFLASLSRLLDDAPPDMPSEFALDRSASLLYANDKVITIDVWSRGFLGGAHGFDVRSVMSFDVSTGRRLLLKELIAPNSRSVFETMSEYEFRRVRQVPVGSSLETAGYFFPPGMSFVLPKNFGIVENGILLFYNPYEVAPYVFGSTEIIMSKDTISPALNSSSPHVAHLMSTAPVPQSANLTESPST